MAKLGDWLHHILVSEIFYIDMAQTGGLIMSHEDTNSSHFQGIQSNHLQHDLRLPKIEVNKFDGSDPMGWVTQMEHYLYFHRINEDL
jgi:hypothetical protein